MASDNGTLLKRTVIAGIAGIYIGWVASRGWTPGTRAYAIGHDLAAQADIFLPVGTAAELIPSLLIGVYFGLALLFTLDWRKHYSGALLIGGTVVGLVVMYQYGTLLANIDMTSQWNIAAAAIGLLASLGVEYDALDDLVFGNSDITEIEFNKAVLGLYVFMMAIGIGSVVQVFISGRWFPTDPLIAAALPFALFGFVEYSTSKQTAVVGGKQSGKTILTYLLYLHFRDRSEGIPPEPSDKLNEVIDTIGQMEPGDDIMVPGTTDINQMYFWFLDDGYFPKRIRYAAHDHDGELIDDMAEYMQRDLSWYNPKAIAHRIRIIWYWVRRKSGRELSRAQEEEYFFYSLRSVDQLVTLIDSRRVIEPKEAGMPKFAELEKVARCVANNGGRVVPVVTKADYIRRNWSGDRIFDLGANGQTNVGYLEEEFIHYVNEGLNNGFKKFEDLMREATHDRAIPVYIEMQQSDDGHLIPKLDDWNNLQPRGIEHLVDVLQGEVEQ